MEVLSKSRRLSSKDCCSYFRRKLIRRNLQKKNPVKEEAEAEAEIPFLDRTNRNQICIDKPEKSAAEKKQLIILKDLGEGIEEANILKIAVKKGDEIKEGTILMRVRNRQIYHRNTIRFCRKMWNLLQSAKKEIKSKQVKKFFSIVSRDLPKNFLHQLVLQKIS